MSSAGVCLHCGSARVHRSRRRGAWERLASFIGATMRRCHECNSRYVKFGGSLFTVAEVVVMRRRLLLATGMGLALVSILVMVFWFNQRQAQ